MVASQLRKRAGKWSAKLTRPLTLESGKKLITLDDARREVLAHMVTEVEDFEFTRAMKLL
jgi:hypothetical protein